MQRLATIKFIASASIVLTAICIMLPGVMGYAFSLARLGTIIIVAVLVSSGLAFLAQFLIKRKNTQAQKSTAINSNATEQEV